MPAPPTWQCRHLQALQGPGFKADTIPTELAGSYPGRRQSLHPGSYVQVDDAAILSGLRSFTLCGWIFPTRHGAGAQAVLSRWTEATGEGFELSIGEESDLVLKLGRGLNHAPVLLHSRLALAMRQWYFVACTIDGAAGAVRLYQMSKSAWPEDLSRHVVSGEIGAVSAAEPGTPLLIGATHLRAPQGRDAVGKFFNGKIDGPAIIARALEAPEILDLHRGRAPTSVQDVIAAWDFAADMGGRRVTDRGPHGLDGRAVNLPARGVTGHNWEGNAQRFSDAPDQYAAIYFHDDDLDDAGWETDFKLAIPATWESGIYAAHLKTSEFDEYVPFIVRPSRAAAPAPIAFLVPTLTYQAYGNEHMPTSPTGLPAALGMSLETFLENEAPPYDQAIFRYIVEQRLHSTYDSHADGSGVCYASRLRPLVNIRPTIRKGNLRFRDCHLFPCDLYILDWLKEKEFPFDTIDDEYLHHEGVALLARYKVIVTGSHPEYWTAAMLAAMRAYLDAGGRLLYLGGNGFYWVISVDPEREHVVEVRRGFVGVRAWTSEPGEQYHSSTGEYGGLWRFRGHPPQALVGIGFSSVSGPAEARPYRRTAASHEAEVAFIFDGVADEIIGDFGLHMGGAAGWELDTVDAKLGTPPHAIVLASSFGHSTEYRPVIEDLLATPPADDRAMRPRRGRI